MSGAPHGVTWGLGFKWNYWPEHLRVTSPHGLGLPKREHPESKCSTRPGWKPHDLFWASLTSHMAPLPLYPVGYRSGQPRFKGAVARSHCRRAGGMGAIVAAILEKCHQPPHDQSMAVSSWDSCPGSLKEKNLEINHGPKEKIPSFNQQVLCVSWLLKFMWYSPTPTPTLIWVTWPLSLQPPDLPDVSRTCVWVPLPQGLCACLLPPLFHTLMLTHPSDLSLNITSSWKPPWAPRLGQTPRIDTHRPKYLITALILF